MYTEIKIFHFKRFLTVSKPFKTDLYTMSSASVILFRKKSYLMEEFQVKNFSTHEF